MKMYSCWTFSNGLKMQYNWRQKSIKFFGVFNDTSPEGKRRFPYTNILNSLYKKEDGKQTNTRRVHEIDFLTCNKFSVVSKHYLAPRCTVLQPGSIVARSCKMNRFLYKQNISYWFINYTTRFSPKKDSVSPHPNIVAILKLFLILLPFANPRHCKQFFLSIFPSKFSYILISLKER
jgi:hypothetical protein